KSLFKTNSRDQPSETFVMTGLQQSAGRRSCPYLLAFDEDVANIFSVDRLLHLSIAYPKHSVLAGDPQRAFVLAEQLPDSSALNLVRPYLGFNRRTIKTKKTFICGSDVYLFANCTQVSYGCFVELLTFRKRSKLLDK